MITVVFVVGDITIAQNSLTGKGKNSSVENVMKEKHRKKIRKRREKMTKRLKKSWLLSILTRKWNVL